MTDERTLLIRTIPDFKGLILENQSSQGKVFVLNDPSRRIPVTVRVPPGEERWLILNQRDIDSGYRVEDE